MKPVSSRFLAALRCSHTARYRVRVLTTFQTGVNPIGTELDIITGSVTLDGTANERGSLDLTVSPGCPSDWPENQFGVLAPFGNELFVERGISGLVQPPRIGSLPAGVIVGWPSTAGSIPTGWSRVTDLDDRYLKGVPDNSTDPGTTGGAASHSHTPAGHSHTTGSHTHGDGASTGPNLTVTGTSGSFPRSRSTHNHAVTINASSDDTGSSSPSTNAVDNDPAYENVIWIVSDGTTDGIPPGAVSWFDDTSFPSGWSQHATGNARFLKGASPGGDGGGTGGANTHTHSGSHTHTNNHTHDFDTPTEDDTLPTGTDASGTGARVVEVHNHAVNVASGGVNTASADLAFSTDSNEPDFYTLALGENVSPGEDLPTGVIAVWRGPLGSIPAGWVLCDGNNGTPDLTGRFIKNATTPATDVGNTGGSTSHSHTGNNHNHSVGSHSHTISYTALLGGGIRSTTGILTVASDLHGHDSHASASATGTTGNAAPDAPTEDHEPPYYEVAFIQLQGTPPDPITPDAEPEYVPLGYFRIETIEQDDAPRSPIRITARDRMAGIIEARMLEPRTFAAGTTFLEVFENLVLEVYPDAVLDIDDEVAGSTLREPATVEEDRYAFLRDMATSRGRVMFFDHRGVLVVAPEPDSTTPVFTVNEGEDGVLINLRRQLSRKGVYNAVVAEGTEADYDNDEPPARAVVFDDNPNSATYFFGPFGQVPRFYSSPFIFTDEQAESAAASILSRTTGIPYTLDITAIPNPALEPLDPIRVIYETSAPVDRLANAVLGFGARGLWKLAETSGATAVDSSGNGNHGTYSGTVTLGGDTFVLGQPAARFAGGRAQTTPNPYVPGNQDTILAWAKINPGDHVAFMTLVGAGSNTWDIRFDSTTQIRCHRLTTATNRNVDITPGSPVDDGLWHMYAVVFDADNGFLRCYFDGQLQPNQLTWTPGETPTTLTNALNIGAANNTGSRPFMGAIAYAAAIPAALSTADIQAIYAAGFEQARQEFEIHVIDAITVPLTSDRPMTISSRSLVQFVAGQEGS